MRASRGAALQSSVKPLRFAFIQPALGVYGGARRIVTMSNLLVERGHDVRIFHPEGTPCEWMPCAAEVLPTERLREDAYDVALFNFAPQLEDARRARARVKLFYVLGLYQKELMVGWRRVLLLRGKFSRQALLRECLQGEFHLLCNSSWMQRWLAENLSLESQLVLGGVDHDLFHPEAGPGPDGVAPRLLYSGDHRDDKGSDVIERALATVRRRRSESVVETYHGRGLSQPEIAAAYARANVFVDAQKSGGWNNPVIEAMACGAPVICTDIGAVQDFAHHDKTALLVPVGDPSALAAAIERLLADPALRARLRAAAIEAARRFQWSEAIDRFLEVVAGFVCNDDGDSLPRGAPRAGSIPDDPPFQG